MIKSKYKILGIDISKASTGWSIVNVDGDKIELEDYGSIPTGRMKSGEALEVIERSIDDIIKKFDVDYASIEQMFVGSNRNTGIKLAYAHGVVQLVLHKNKVPHCYYSVMTLKSKTLGGIKTKKEDGTTKSGDEMKDEVSLKIREIFGDKSFIKEYNNDVTDSISAAYTFFLMEGKEVEKAKKGKVKK